MFTVDVKQQYNNNNLILKEHLKVRKISARWVPHLLTDELKRQQVKVAKKLLQMFPKYDKEQFANVITGDETWVLYFEPVRKVSNKIWATTHSKHPIIAKRSLSAKKFCMQSSSLVKELQ